MKKKRTTFEQAIKEYTEFFDKIPTLREIEDAYHKYSQCWKPYDGFKEYLQYMA